MRSEEHRNRPPPIARAWPWAILWALWAMFSASCARNPTGPDLSVPISPLLVDFSQAWSHDGRLIAFRRPYASNYGPPGIYLISASGGTPRWLAPASLNSPGNLQFSPDDRQLVGTDNLELVILDVSTGARSTPLYTNSGVYYPSWAPDGHTIAYYRVSFDSFAPADSSFIHTLDLTTSTDMPVVVGGQHLIGFYLHYAPDGRLAFVQNLPPSKERLAILDFRTGSLTSALEGGALQDFVNLQWVWRSISANVSLIFTMRPGGSWMVNPDGTSLRRFAHPWDLYDVVSPDGTQFVTQGEDPLTHVGILDIVNIDDISGASRRHLTSFAEPS